MSDDGLTSRAASLAHGVVRYTSTGTWSGSACSVWSHGTGRHTAVQVRAGVTDGGAAAVTPRLR